MAQLTKLHSQASKPEQQGHTLRKTHLSTRMHIHTWEVLYRNWTLHLCSRHANQSPNKLPQEKKEKKNFAAILWLWEVKINDFAKSWWPCKYSPVLSFGIDHFLSVNMALTSHSRFLIWSIRTFISWFFWRTLCKWGRGVQVSQTRSFPRERGQSRFRFNGAFSNRVQENPNKLRVV